MFRHTPKVLPQFQKIIDLPKKAVVNLWFGDDLFCLFNLCFVIYLLDRVGKRDNIFVVKAQKENWLEFGGMSKQELLAAFDNRKLMTKEEFQLLLQTWLAFQQNDKKRLSKLANTPTKNFPFFKEAIQAHLDRFPAENQLGRPQKSLWAIQKRLNSNDFGVIFQQFSKEEGIYGFGDLQVKRIWDALSSDPDFNFSSPHNI